MVTTDTKKGFIKLGAAADAKTGELPIQFVYLYAKAAVAGDDYLLTDTAGNEIYRDVATAANYSRIFPVNRRVSGVIAATIDTVGAYFMLIMDKQYGRFAS